MEQAQSSLTVRTPFQPLAITRDLAWIIGFAVLTAASAKLQFYFPFSPVPVTLQTFSVMLAGAWLGPRNGALSQVALIGLGLMGFPVFSQALPGYLVLMGPTGGYIIGFVLAAWMTGVVYKKMKNSPLYIQFILLFVASLYIFIPGVFWLGMFTGFDWSKILTAGFVFHLPGDIAKCLMVLACMKAGEKFWPSQFNRF